MATEMLDSQRVRWIRENARPAKSPCLDGCGGLTPNRFLPGHDARLRAQLNAIERAGGPLARSAREAKRRLGWD